MREPGNLRWSFDPLPAGLKNAGAANAWGVPSRPIAERDLVFVPTGSASPDFYGGERPGNNGYANSVVAIRASTGKVVWAFRWCITTCGITMSPRNLLLVTFRRGNTRFPPSP